jgi:hypothetical protein
MVLLSAPVTLSLGRREHLRVLTVSCRISSAVSSGRVPIAFSTPHKISFSETHTGAEALLRAEKVASFKGTQLRLTTVLLSVGLSGCCALCRCWNLLHCLALKSSNMRTTFSVVMGVDLLPFIGGQVPGQAQI